MSLEGHLTHAPQLRKGVIGSSRDQLSVRSLLVAGVQKPAQKATLAGLFDDFEHLLDDLVGEGEQCLRHSEVERLGGLHVDCELKLDRLLHGQVRGFGTL